MKKCVECKTIIVGKSSLCEKCFKRALREKIENE